MTPPSIVVEMATFSQSEDHRDIAGNLGHDPPAPEVPKGYRAEGPWIPYAAYTFSQSRGGGYSDRLHVVRWRRVYVLETS